MTPPPPAVHRAARLMWLGAALAAGEVVVFVAIGLPAALVWAVPAVAVWGWMAVANRDGRPWARRWSTALGAAKAATTAPLLLVGLVDPRVLWFAVLPAAGATVAIRVLVLLQRPEVARWAAAQNDTW